MSEPEPKLTTRAVKNACVEYSCRLLRRAGCLVDKADTPTGYTLTITVPPDALDPHGDRLKAAIASAT